MNITILTNRDFPALLCANLLIPKLTSHTISVLMTEQVGNPKNQAKGLQALSKVDSALQGNLPNLGDKPMFGFDDLPNLGIPSKLVSSVRKEEGYQILRDTHPDFIISIRFGAILDERAIAVSPKGVLNLHSGILPDYRGVMATFWAMFNGASYIGSTLHAILDSSIDTGDIQFVDKVKTKRHCCYFSNVVRLYLSAIPRLLITIENIAQGHVFSGIKQAAKGGYFTYPDDDTLIQFEKKGHILADEQAVRQLLLNP